MKLNGDKVFQSIANIIMMLLSATCILPFLLLIASSITDEKLIILNGYSYFPGKISFAAYSYLWSEAPVIFKAYGITIFVTLVGTIGSLIITSMLAYPLSRKDMPLRIPIAFLVFFTMLFNGGLVPTYLMYTQYFHIKNTIWALIFPTGLLMNGFNIMLMRTFFITSVPDAIIESAKIDGAGEFKIFYEMILPLSLPIMATVGLFEGIGYWNDWFNGLIYLTKPSLFSIQNILNRIITDIQFLSTTNLGAQAGVVTNIPSTGIRMAIAVIGVIPIIILYPFFQRYFVKGIAVGSVKG